MPLRFTFRQLEYLVAVGDAETIALAADRLNVSSPSISSAISQLEAHFGIQIFVRHHAQGLSLTPGGRRLFNAARQILDSAAALNDLASDITQRARGPLAVGALTTLAPLISASVRRSFQAENPDADVTLAEGNQADLLRMLGRAEIDVAITYDIEIPKDILFERLISLSPSVMLPSNHPLATRHEIDLSEIAAEALVLLDMPLSRDYFLSLFHEAGLRPNITERTQSLSVVRSLVANGFGYSIANIRAQSDLAPDGERLAIVPLAGGLRPVTMGLATKQSVHRSRIVSAFFAHLHARAAAGDLPGTA